eukprot:5123373-Pyramimonas_sp.AAC.2
MYNAIGSSASSGNVPWVGGLEPFIMGKHLPVLRGKMSVWEVPRELGGRRRIEDLSAVVTAPWLDAKAPMEYRITQPFLTQ